MAIIHKARNPDLWLPKRQPRGAVEIDWTHPLSLGLKSAWLFRDGPANIRDLVTGRLATLSLNNTNSDIVEPVVNAHGRAVRFTNSGSDYLTLGTPDQVYGPSSSFGLIRSRQATGVTQSTLGDSGTFDVLLPWSDNKVYLDYPSTGSRVSVAVPASNTAANLIETWLLHAGSAGRGIWLDGVPLLANTTTVTTATPASTGSFYLNKSASVAGALQEFNFFVSWSRQLPDSEIRLWSASPYAFLKPAG